MIRSPSIWHTLVHPGIVSDKFKVIDLDLLLTYFLKSARSWSGLLVMQLHPHNKSDHLQYGTVGASWDWLRQVQSLVTLAYFCSSCYGQLGYTQAYSNIWVISTLLSDTGPISDWYQYSCLILVQYLSDIHSVVWYYSNIWVISILLSDTGPISQRYPHYCLILVQYLSDIPTLV